MIKLKATALIRSISPVIEIPSRSGGQSFLKRELVLDDSWTKDGNTHESFVLIEFTGDKMAQLDAFAPGQRVNVEAYVSGREYQGKAFNTIKGSTVELFQAQQPAPSTGQYSQTSGGYPQQPQYPQAPGYPQQGAYPPGGYSPQPAYPPTAGYPQQGTYPQSPTPMPGVPQGGNLGPEGLPFR
jgi:chromosome undetermined scaffold_112, whole genome shotgun sequence